MGLSQSDGGMHEKPTPNDMEPVPDTPQKWEDEGVRVRKRDMIKSFFSSLFGEAQARLIASSATLQPDRTQEMEDLSSGWLSPIPRGSGTSTGGRSTSPVRSEARKHSDEKTIKGNIS